MMLMLTIAVFLTCFHSFVAPPVNPEPPMPQEGGDPTDSTYLQLEYKKYLEEVVAVLEEDEAFKKELDAMGEQNLEEGAIAHYLQFANKNTRTKLDELKRLEVRRLKDLHKKMMREMAAEARANKGRPTGDLPNVDLEHLDTKNPHSFEMEDLKKLIQKTTDDLKNLDNRRKQEFKQYEMQKEHEKREKQKTLNDDDKEKFLKEEEERLKRHKDHPKVNHPGNKAQLEDVWAKADLLNPAQFDPKIFFRLHDIDGDGYLNPQEIEALFQRELDKVYDPENADDDMVERNEEMNKMREHVFTQIDMDRDGMVSWQEFDESTKADEFNKDEDWDTLDEEEMFDDAEMEAFEKALAEEEELRIKNLAGAAGLAASEAVKQAQAAAGTQDQGAPAPPQDAGVPPVPNEVPVADNQAPAGDQVPAVDVNKIVPDQP